MAGPARSEEAALVAGSADSVEVWAAGSAEAAQVEVGSGVSHAMQSKGLLSEN